MKTVYAIFENGIRAELTADELKKRLLAMSMGESYTIRTAILHKWEYGGMFEPALMPYVSITLVESRDEICGGYKCPFAANTWYNGKPADCYYIHGRRSNRQLDTVLDLAFMGAVERYETGKPERAYMLVKTAYNEITCIAR